MLISGAVARVQALLSSRGGTGVPAPVELAPCEEAAWGCSPEGFTGCAALSHLTRGPCRGCAAARRLQPGRLPLHWDASERRGGKGRTQVCQDYLAISPLTPDPRVGCAPRRRDSTEQLPESIPVLKLGLCGM